MISKKSPLALLPGDLLALLGGDGGALLLGTVAGHLPSNLLTILTRHAAAFLPGNLDILDIIRRARPGE